ncbi:MAG: YqaE/Pmp3 family membrane protein [Cyclobacteriaceae bacterium]|nr:YqaE/Pmp3 family membrane protein [Cyclobacteriaceae bacterium]
MKNLFYSLSTLIIFMLINQACAPKYGAYFQQTNRSLQYSTTTPIQPGIAEADTPELEMVENATTALLKTEETTSSTSDRMEASSMEANTRIRPVLTAPGSGSMMIPSTEKDIPAVDKKELRSFRKAFRNERAEIRRNLKQWAESGDFDKTNATHNDDYLLMMVVAFFLPPLAVYLTYGPSDQFLISLVLLLIWPASIIYSMIMVHKYYMG